MTAAVRNAASEAHVDDLAAHLTPRHRRLLTHLASNSLEHKERAPRIDGKLLIPRLGRDPQESGDLNDPGIVDQDVDSAKRANCHLHQPLNIGQLRNVHRHSDSATALALEFRHHLLGALSTDVGDDDGRAFLDKMLRCRSPNPAGAARDDSDVAVQFTHCHLPSVHVAGRDTFR